MVWRACSMNFGEVRKAVQGRLSGSPQRPITGVSTDTRDPLAGGLYVALRGERFDGHDFLAQAIEGGAQLLLVERAAYAKRQSKLPKGDHGVVVVQDSLTALGDLAAWHRRRMPAKLFAISGSNGKTTTKELLAALLSSQGPVCKTEGNLNNLIGVPMTLLGIGPEHHAAVIEMGMSAPGELARLTAIARPDVATLLNIGPAHLGCFSGMEGIAEAKAELFHGLETHAIAVACLDDPLVVRAAASARLTRSRRFGRAANADVELLETIADANGQTVKLRLDHEQLALHMRLRGSHNALNLCAAVASATALYPLSEAEMAASLETLEPVAGRGRQLAIGDLCVIDDSYNANRNSMLAAIQCAEAEAKRQHRPFAALLGEMLELGEASQHEHQMVGEALRRASASVVGAYGPQAGPLIEASLEADRLGHHEADDADALVAWFSQRVEPGSLVLVKASRGMHMETLIQKLKELRS